MAGRHAAPEPSKEREATPTLPPGASRAPGRRRGTRSNGRRRFALAPWIIVSLVTVLMVSTFAVGYGWLARQGCDGAPTAITVVASPDQAKVLASLAQAWTEGGAEVDGRCVTAEVVSKDSSEVAAALSPSWDSRRDGPRPDVWAPDSTAWLQVASSRPEAAALVPSLQPSLARSPVVIAMPRPMAQALRWPHDGLGWRDLATGIGRPGGGGWRTYGYGWGAFQLGMTDPARSTAGLHALMAITDHNNDERIADDELAFSRVLERAVTHYEPDSSTMFEQLAEADAANKAMSYVSAFPALERDVSQYNSTGPTVPLVALYPPEGTADADHPYLALRAPWVDARRQQIAARFLAYARGEDGRAAYAAAGFRGPDRSPSPDLTRKRGFEPVVGPPARNVLLPDSVTRTVVSWTALRRRANVLAVIDVSGSMRDPVPGAGGTKLEVAQSAAIRAVGQFNGATKLALWEFSIRLDGERDHRRLVPLGPLDALRNGRTGRQRAVEALEGLRPRGATALYDTALAAYVEATRTWEGRRLNLVVLLTDGRNEDPESVTRERLLSRLRELVDPGKPVQIVTIAYGADADVDALQAISRVTGGRTFVSKNAADIDKVFLAAVFGR